MTLVKVNGMDHRRGGGDRMGKEEAYGIACVWRIEVLSS